MPEGADTGAAALRTGVGLTARELDVAQRAAAGDSSLEIAADLGISVRTVETHLQRTFRKHGVSRRDALASVLGQVAQRAGSTSTPVTGSRGSKSRSTLTVMSSVTVLVCATAAGRMPRTDEAGLFRLMAWEHAPVDDGDDRNGGFLAPLMGDGRPLLLMIAGSLLFAGGFLMFLAATGDVLPQDLHYLGMSPDQLCAIAGCRVTDFMVHDRASFGGTLFGLGVLYVWLTVFPLARGEQWAWWAWLMSGILGFTTFLAYLGYGYLDTWHGIGTLLMLPVYVLGMARTRHLVSGALDPRCLLRSGGWLHRRDRFTLGRIVLILGAAAVAASGLIILRIGVGDTFVPEDLQFIGRTADEIRSQNPHLVPLLAHDRAGFGGGVVTMGLTTMICLWCAPLSRHLHQAVALAGAVSLCAALVVHFAVGYTNAFHLAPPVAAAICLLAGLALEHPGVPSSRSAHRATTGS